VTALHELTLEARTGERLGIVGPSGCGKSTLLELVCGLQEPTAGTLAVDGAGAVAERLRRCALMPQRDLLLPWRNALDNAALALELSGLRRREARRRALPLFERFGLQEFARASPAELSGGMRQRVSFARTLLAGKPVLLLDEPFGSLDSITRAELQEWLAGALASEPRTTLLVTHDVEEALFLCDRVLILSRRPGTVRAELNVVLDRSRPRREQVTSPEFAALKERALEALA
jgi:ABC-type nitrate/sulfonate/bicarbonate transport system ATPase subunit